MAWGNPHSYKKVRVDELQMWLMEDVTEWRVYGPYKPFGDYKLVHGGELANPTLVGEEIVCMTPTTGVQLFNTSSQCWTENPSFLGTAKSVAVSLGRNIVVQTNDSIQIFSTDAIVHEEEAHGDILISHVYPLGEKHIVCVQSDRRIVLLELETVQKASDNNTSSLWSLLANLSPFGNPSPVTNQSPFAGVSFTHGLVAKFGVLLVMQAWQSRTPLPKWTGTAYEDVPLSGLSPESTWVVTVYSSPWLGVTIEDAENRNMLVNQPLEYDDLGGKVYGLGFNSETRFYLKVDGQGWHARVPYDITPSLSGPYPQTVTRGKPVPLPEPRATLPYTLDANCEWVIDSESRKICWISPGNLRRGDGGHFWAGSSLVMVGDDGVVRKLSFKEPGHRDAHDAA